MRDGTSGGGNGGAHGGFQFGARDGGSAVFHDHDAAGKTGDVRGFEIGGANGESDGEGGDDGVAGAGDVAGVLGAVDGNLLRRVFGVEEDHAVAAAGDQESFEAHFFEKARAEFFEAGFVGADLLVVDGFDFSFIGRGGGDAGAAEM